MEQQSRSIVKDTALYMVAKIVEGLIGIITITVYTYCFIPEEYGRYNIVNLTIVTSAMIVMQWLSQAIMRYVNEYKNEEKKFYSTAVFIWLKINIISTLICSLGIVLYSIIFDSSLIIILLLSLIMFVSYGATLVVLNILVAKRKVKLNLIISLGSTVFKLIVALMLIKVFGAKIEWILLSNIIFDILTVIIVIVKLDIAKYISYKSYSKNIFDKFIVYGLPLIGLTFSTAILYNSSRYVIQIIIGSAAVGIYYANQSLMSSAFSMLSNAVMKGSYPSILKVWNDGDKQQTAKLISQSVRTYMLLAVPAVAGIVVLAEPISNMLLEPSYVEGYTVMKWTALGMTLLGITEYRNKYWELEVNTKTIFKQSLVSGVITIILNLILVPIFEYKVAAVVTTLGFLVYFVISYIGSRKYIRWTLTYINYLRIIGSAFIMGIIIKIVLHIIGKSFINIVILITIGVVVYVLLLYITGEIKEEVKLLKGIVKYNSK